MCVRIGYDTWDRLTDTSLGAKAETLASARRLCDACPLREPCLELALDLEQNRGLRNRHGIWGGLDAAERFNLARSRQEQP